MGREGRLSSTASSDKEPNYVFFVQAVSKLWGRKFPATNNAHDVQSLMTSLNL